MRKAILSVALALMLLVVFAVPIFAATSQDVTVNATPSFISISNSQSTYNFGVVVAGTTPTTATDWSTITNSSSVSTDIEISVTTATWSGGVTWTHSDTATAGEDTAGLKAGTGGTNDIIVKFASPNDLVSALGAGTPYDWNLQLIAPSSFTDGVQKEIVVRLTAVEAS
ncbi:hypothetical protein ES703_110510 [subsurface metagenome]